MFSQATLYGGITVRKLQSVLCTVHSGQKMHAQELLFASEGSQQLQHMIKQELDWIDKTRINKIWIDKKEIKMKLVMQCQQRNSPLVWRCTCRDYILLIK